MNFNEQGFNMPVSEKFKPKDQTSLGEGDPLLKVREEQMKEIRDVLEQNDCIVLGTVARTGTTSILRNLNNVYGDKPNVKLVSLDTNDTRFNRDIEDLLDEQEDDENQRQIILTIDEANRIWLDKENNIKEIRGEYDDEYKDGPNLFELKKLINEAKNHNIKIVFQSHDTYGKEGDGGMIGMEKWLKKNFFRGQEIKMKKMQLETIDEKDMKKVFDIIASNMDMPKTLIDAKQEILDLCTTPQQLCLIINEYIYATSKNKNHQEALEEALHGNRAWIMDESLNDIIRTTAKERMGKLLKKVADAEGGVLDINQLSEDEKRIFERYKKFHLFRINGDNISVNGQLLREFVQKKY
ncbi:MAG: hypothetical protein WCV59_00700 [Parcubacteria group bacterium]|jgi:hypothetical protein